MANVDCIGAILAERAKRATERFAAGYRQGHFPRPAPGGKGPAMAQRDGRGVAGQTRGGGVTMTAYPKRPVGQRIPSLEAALEPIAKLHELCASEPPVIERISLAERPLIEVEAYR